MKTSRWTYFLFGLLVLLLVLSMASCKTTYHYKRILKKNPDFFRVDTTTTRTVIDVPEVSTTFHCDSIGTSPVVLRIPANTKYDTITRFVTIRLSKSDSSQITAAVDCPDVEIIEKKIPEPYPVYLQPSFWKKAEIFGAGALALLFAVVIFIFIKKIFL